MNQKQPNGFYQSTLLNKIPNLVHAFSSRRLNDMRDEKNRKSFLATLGLKRKILVQPEQVHGGEVSTVSYARSDGIINDADGLVSKIGNSTLLLGVRTADCLPILAVDPIEKIIGVAHAGWRGTLAGISISLIDTFIKVGSKPKNIFVVIGPHIGMCCYDVPEERAKRFRSIFENDPKAVSQIQDRWYIDIGYLNYKQLLVQGVTPEHIDASPTCTSCQHDEFFSYRKDTKETFGEMMGVIGFQ